ncbi:MAG: response regulator [Bacteroidota bacterium]
MKNQLDHILLIDDNAADNFFNETMIRRSCYIQRLTVVQTAEAALLFLRSDENGKPPKPDLIFLDINMPRMNGWEFLDEYKKLDERQKASIVIVMLTTSLNPEDMEKAQAIDEINDFRNKPISESAILEIIESHF